MSRRWSDICYLAYALAMANGCASTAATSTVKFTARAVDEGHWTVPRLYFGLSWYIFVRGTASCIASWTCQFCLS